MSTLVVLPASGPAERLVRTDAVGLRAVLGRLGVSLTVACAVPGLLLYVLLQASGVVPAVLAALAWCYGATAWRYLTGRAVSGLLLVTATVLTMRTAFALATGNTFVYFLEPIVTDAVLAVVFVLSLVSGRPLARRLATDFYPLDDELARTPAVVGLLRRLTLLWAGVGLLKSAVGLWLLTSLPAADFVLVKTSVVIAVTVAAVAVTVRSALAVLAAETRLVS